MSGMPRVVSYALAERDPSVQLMASCSIILRDPGKALSSAKKQFRNKDNEKVNRRV